MAKGDLIIRSSWKSSNKISFANCLLRHISACLRRICSTWTLLLCGQCWHCVPWGTRIFVIERERDKTLGATAHRDSALKSASISPTRSDGAESFGGPCWGSLRCMLRYLRVFLGRGRLSHKLKLQVFSIIWKGFLLLLSSFLNFISKGCKGCFARGVTC